ncbi:MAG: FAD-dependent oxidoreductase [Schwartzia sp.]|nr:FAD-dependent oxidoreductase [Schwartzia sp. (in: firmicutes)]
MAKRILIVGGVTGGASAAARLRRLDESAEIIIFERGPHVSYSNCSLPYFLNRVVPDSSSLLMVTPERFKKQYNIEVRTENEVISINRATKMIRVKRIVDGMEYEEHYDVLILSPGAEPIRPKSIEGIDHDNVVSVRSVVDIEKLDHWLLSHDVKDVAVVGGGFIGCEVAENLRESGRNVTLIEAMPQIMMPFDFDMAQILHKEMLDHGIKLVLKDGVKRIAENNLELASGRKIAAGAVVLAIGVHPETELAKVAGLEIGKTGGIRVNHNYQTNDSSIYAVGDAIEVFHRLTRQWTRLALAWPAQMQGRAVADHISGLSHRAKGVIGSSVLRVFDLYAACTGLSVRAAKEAGIPCESSYVIPADKVSLMPGSAPIHLKLVFETPTGRILGAQAIGKDAADRRIDVIAALISMGGTLEDLKETELCYAPVSGTAKDAVHMAALVGLNLLDGRFHQVPVSSVRGLVESGAYIVDVREKGEYEASHLKNAVNIPLSELRNRMGEIPKDCPVYLHCRSSQRSYNAIMALQQNGFDNVINIAGSYLGICLYEYAQDVLECREKIVTAYNFN